MSPKDNQRGFTLVELSIVLVILGLLVGGVLSGQSLIHSAQLRAVITERDQYAAAINTFKGKYLGLPGDITNGIQFWPASTCGANNNTPATSGVAACNGDGDGKISWAEGPTMWKHLELAGLIPGSTIIDCFNQGYASTGTSAYGFGSSQPYVRECSNYPGITIPKSKMSGNLGWTVYYSVGRSTNVAQLSGTPSKQTYNYIGHGTGGITPSDAWNIDKKMDDGDPYHGSVDAGPASGSCYTLISGGTSTYNVTNNTLICPLWFKLGV